MKVHTMIIKNAEFKIKYVMKLARQQQCKRAHKTINSQQAEKCFIKNALNHQIFAKLLCQVSARAAVVAAN
jgi:hypothetical protein